MLLNDFTFTLFTPLCEVCTGFCASYNMPEDLFHLKFANSHLYTRVTGSDSLNDGLSSLSSERSIKYHSDASVTIPNTLSTSYPLSISSALRLRDKVDSICTDAWANPFIKSSFFNFNYTKDPTFYCIVEISMPI